MIHFFPTCLWKIGSSYRAKIDCQTIEERNHQEGKNSTYLLFMCPTILFDLIIVSFSFWTWINPFWWLSRKGIKLLPLIVQNWIKKVKRLGFCFRLQDKSLRWVHQPPFVFRLTNGVYKTNQLNFRRFLARWLHKLVLNNSIPLTFNNVHFRSFYIYWKILSSISFSLPLSNVF